MSIFAGIDPAIQRATLWASIAWHAWRKPTPELEWVVGPVEVAGLVRALTEALPSAESAVHEAHPFYAHAYDWVTPAGRSHLRRLLQGPWKLGELMARARGFLYVGGVGFLDTMNDGRSYEFSVLRARGKKIVCYFTGNDIRSPKLSAQRESATGEPNLGTYLAETDPRFASDAYELSKRALAESAERHAHVIFNADVGQPGHFTRPSEPFLYFHPDAEICDDFSKFATPTKPIILHAPSSPVVKGTQLVRAAINELRDEGFEFEYVELVREPHDQVREQLKRAHIVLNQFYSEVPGVFGVEALAAGCVVLMRADERDEPILPIGSNRAWVVTRHYQVTKHLRELLVAPDGWEGQARAGVAWVRAHASAAVTGEILRNTLSRIE